MKSLLWFLGFMSAVAVCCVPVSCQYAVANGDTWLKLQNGKTDMTGFEASCALLATFLACFAVFCFVKQQDYD